MQYKISWLYNVYVEDYLYIKASSSFTKISFPNIQLYLTFILLYMCDTDI
jgi:hypothetical protein